MHTDHLYAVRCSYPANLSPHAVWAGDLSDEGETWSKAVQNVQDNCGFSPGPYVAIRRVDKSPSELVWIGTITEDDEVIDGYQPTTTSVPRLTTWPPK